MSTVGTTGQPTIFTGNTNNNAGGTVPASAGSGTLTQNDFLNLLVAQLQYQDPTNPESDTDMAAQMAQFGSLSAINNLSSTMQLSQAASLIGATVTTSAMDSNGNAIAGPVSAATISTGAVSVTVNGQTVPVSEITSVAPTPVTQPTQSGTSS